MNDRGGSSPALRSGEPLDTESCVEIWVAACAARDGQAYNGVADRARPKFHNSSLWIVAENRQIIDGFVLATGPGSGMPTDPPDAAVIGLLAVTPGHQTRGLGRALLRAATDDLMQLGYEKAVLHALVDNVPAVQLYESEGWAAVGAEYEHSLLKRPIRTFRRSLKTD
jgi:ribosomal protein S18 acetylase RimI-like enzyme